MSCSCKTKKKFFLIDYFYVKTYQKNSESKIWKKIIFCFFFVANGDDDTAEF